MTRHLPAALVLILLASLPLRADAPADSADVIVYGGTPAGIATALAAARQPAHVLLLEPSHWVGGMVAGGLSRTDLGRPETIGGIAREFFTRAAARYHDPKWLWYAEPKANLETFRQMLAEAHVRVMLDAPIRSARRDGRRIVREQHAVLELGR